MARLPRLPGSASPGLFESKVGTLASASTSPDWTAIMIAVPLLAFALCLVIALGQGYQGFSSGNIDWNGVIAAYLGIPIFALLWFSYKLKHKTKLVRFEEMTFPERD